MKKALLVLLFFGLLLLICLNTPLTSVPASPPAEAQLPTAVPPAPASPRPTEPRRTPSPIPATAAPSPTASPTPTPTPAPTPFTIVWMSDTQHMSSDNPDAFNCVRDWILANREKENIQFVVHSGDVVDGIGPTQASKAAAAMVPIFEALPGMIAEGNHDGTRTDNHWNFSQTPYAKLVHKKGQILEENDGVNVMAAYVTFRAADTDFLVIGINYLVVCDVWVNQVIAQHPDHVVIVVVHKGLQENGAHSRETHCLYKRVMPNWPNFRLILCGHWHGTQHRIDWFDDDKDNTPDRAVHTLMFNYQDDWKEGVGYIRLLRFDPADHSIEVLTYSPWYDRWGYPKATDEENHFVLENAW